MKIVIRRLSIFCIVLLGVGKACLAQALFLSDSMKERRAREFGEGWMGYHASFDTSGVSDQRLSLSCLSLSNREHPTLQIRPKSLPVPVASSAFFSQHLGFRPQEGESFWCFSRAEVSLGSNWTVRLGLGGGLPVSSQKPDYHFEEASVDLRINKLHLSVGRRPLFWGQSLVSPLSISYNATPLNSVQLASEPVQLPWFFKNLGFFRSEIFWALLDGQRNPPHDYFLGMRLGWMPSSRWETNLSLLYQFGGDGPEYDETWTDWLLEFIGARPGHKESITTGSAANRQVSFDLRYRFAGALPLSVYTEHHLEDCCGDFFGANFWKQTLKYRYSYVGGMAWSLNRWFDSTLRMEYLRATNLYNFHPKWPSAFSYQGRELGAYSGRDSRVGVVDWQMTPPDPMTLIRFAFFVQEMSHYSRIHFGEKGTALVAYEPSYESSEWRVGSVFEAGFIDPVLTLDWGAAIGVERIWNRSYQDGVKDWGFAAVIKAKKGF